MRRKKDTKLKSKGKSKINPNAASPPRDSADKAQPLLTDAVNHASFLMKRDKLSAPAAASIAAGAFGVDQTAICSELGKRGAAAKAARAKVDSNGGRTVADAGDVAASLARQGAFYVTGSDNPYWAPKGEGAVACRSEAFRDAVSALAPGVTGKQLTALIKDVTAVGSKDASSSRCGRLCVWHRKAKCFYVSIGGGNVIEVGPTESRLVKNGTCGIIFDDPPDFEPLDPETLLGIPQDDAFNQFKEALVKQLPPAPEDGLMQSELGAVYVAGWIGFFLQTMARARPIIAIIGPKGSGKTVTGRQMGKALYGSRFDVSMHASRSRSVKDLAATIAFRALVVRDDLQEAPDGLMELLCQVSTGARFDLSKFHETLAIESYDAVASIVITAIRPKWALRDDVISRLLALRFARPPASSVTDGERERRVLKRRHGVWAATLYMLRAVLTNKIKPKPITRFVDWERGARAALRPMKAEAALVRALQKMEVQRVAIALKADPFLGLLRAVAEKYPNEWWLAAELADAVAQEMGVQEQAGGEDQPREPHLVPYAIRNPRSLSKLLQHIEEAGSTVVDVERSPQRATNNMWRWRVRPI